MGPPVSLLLSLLHPSQPCPPSRPDLLQEGPPIYLLLSQLHNGGAAVDGHPHSLCMRGRIDTSINRSEHMMCIQTKTNRLALVKVSATRARPPPRRIASPALLRACAALQTGSVTTYTRRSQRFGMRERRVAAAARCSLAASAVRCTWASRGGRALRGGQLAAGRKGTTPWRDGPPLLLTLHQQLDQLHSTVHGEPTKVAITHPPTHPATSPPTCSVTGGGDAGAGAGAAARAARCRGCQVGAPVGDGESMVHWFLR